ncbi:macro domain-containing protein [Myxococcota bacterium]|nr:macro domain-containing protein [Myxococcota bacterium]MBU1380230.1 macro domain-containing protein [Myxococcota bacterium]MBU1499096.1 macro domain-containing protein [Myxococcota bacterium]
MNNIEILLGDITKAEVDAIVNAANPTMLGGGGVDGAIHRAAGSALLDACRKVVAVNGARCPFGESRITQAGNLKSKYVIHTAGPIYHSNDNPSRTLRNSYTSALNLAMENGCTSIAFPAISCGAYGYPHSEAARIALGVCSRPEYSSLKIFFYIYDRSLYTLFVNIRKSLKG